jgi:hypothetical protein
MPSRFFKGAIVDITRVAVHSTIVLEGSPGFGIRQITSFPVMMRRRVFLISPGLSVDGTVSPEHENQTKDKNHKKGVDS